MTTRWRAAAMVLMLLTLGAAPAWTKEETLCPGDVVPLQLSTFHSPFARFRLGGRMGYFQLDTGSTISTVDARMFNRPPGAAVLLDGSSFPTLAGGKFHVLNFALIAPPGIPGGQAGQLGTDFLRGVRRSSTMKRLRPIW
jgi:hypothetical protein